jgi:ethanolamine utilization protein EutQ (cupin superfamily)
MAHIKFCRPENRQFEQTGGDSRDIRIARDVTTEDSRTLGTGVMTLENCSAEWTVLYDEYLYCLEGTLTLKTKQGEFILDPGCSIWLPDKTWLIYEAKRRATVLFVVYPVDWRNRQPQGI